MEIIETSIEWMLKLSSRRETTNKNWPSTNTNESTPHQIAQQTATAARTLNSEPTETLLNENIHALEDWFKFKKKTFFYYKKYRPITPGSCAANSENLLKNKICIGPSLSGMNTCNTCLCVCLKLLTCTRIKTTQLIETKHYRPTPV